MNWTNHPLTGYTDVTIDSNCILLNNELLFYKKSKSVLRITKTTGIPSPLTINGITYPFAGIAGAVFYVEMTNLVGATDGTGMFVVQNGNDIVLQLDYRAVNGMKQSLIVSDCAPSLVPVLEGSDLPFYLQSVNDIEWLQTNGEWYVMGVNDYPMSRDIQIAINGGYYSTIFRTTGETFDETFDSTFQVNDEETRFFQLDPINCEFDHILVEWVSRFGNLKSWWFEVEKTINESPKQLDLEVLDDGFNTIKNKQVSLLLTSKRNDIYNQTYLADLVISDEVYIYDGDSVGTKRQGKITQNNFEIEKKRKDVSLMLNTYRYDTI